MKTKYSISFIGSGNVAHHLATALFAKDFIIKQICSKSIENARALATKVNALAVNNLNEIDSTVDCIVIAVSDDAILDIATELKHINTLVVHTSGTVHMDILKELPQHGIFYPLQTFSKDKKINLSEVPFCLEANSPENLERLEMMANELTNTIYYLSSDQRKQVHVAAVFACNFTNHMYTIASEILEKNNIELDLLKPLIKETALKIIDAAPAAVQTGPAKRQDTKTIANHMEMLNDSPSYKAIYDLITKNIIDHNGKL